MRCAKAVSAAPLRSNRAGMVENLAARSCQAVCIDHPFLHISLPQTSGHVALRWVNCTLHSGRFEQGLRPTHIPKRHLDIVFCSASATHCSKVPSREKRQPPLICWHGSEGLRASVVLDSAVALVHLACLDWTLVWTMCNLPLHSKPAVPCCASKTFSSSKEV